MEAISKPSLYEEYLASPTQLVAEIVQGSLYTSPRPAPQHAFATSMLGAELIPPWRRGKGGPGGWLLLDEPELRIDEHILVPDLAGWRTERLPSLPDEAYFTTRPDWVCEVLSPSTARLDRGPKQAVYAAAGIPWMWMVDPLARFIEVFENVDGAYVRRQIVGDEPEARLAPFAAVPIDVRELWFEPVKPSN